MYMVTQNLVSFKYLIRGPIMVFCVSAVLPHHSMNYQCSLLLEIVISALKSNQIGEPTTETPELFQKTHP